MIIYSNTKVAFYQNSFLMQNTFSLGEMELPVQTDIILYALMTLSNFKAAFTIFESSIIIQKQTEITANVS